MFHYLHDFGASSRHCVDQIDFDLLFALLPVRDYVTSAKSSTALTAMVAFKDPCRLQLWMTTWNGLHPAQRP
jgi:hypothetical protein